MFVFFGMDTAKEQAARSRETDSSKISEVYQNHLRAGGTPLEFAACALEQVECAKKRVARGEERAAQDIVYMLCRTAELVIPEWNDECTSVVPNMPLHRDIFRWSSSRNIYSDIESGKVAGEIRRICGVVIDGSFMCTQGFFRIYPHEFKESFTILDKVAMVDTITIIGRCRELTETIYRRGISQKIIQAIDTLDNLQTVPEYGRLVDADYRYSATRVLPLRIVNLGKGLNHVVMFPTCFKHPVVARIFDDNTLYALRIDDKTSLVDQYENSLDSIRFEKERRERGDPPGALLDYLRQRDLKT